jgi:hypothetical protein
MELNMNDFDDSTNMNPYDTFDYKSYEENNSDNYWDNHMKKENVEKKKVSFNDILNNMNLVVNSKGVLQFMYPTQEQSNDINQQEQSYNYNPNDYTPNDYNKKTVSYNNTNDYNNINNIKPVKPIDPSVKHSYIYNKYFKDYVDPNPVKEPVKVPKTLEEYKQMVLEQKIKAIQNKKRIEEIKSTKMMFTTVPGSNANPRVIKASTNNLRSMKFG